MQCVQHGRPPTAKNGDNTEIMSVTAWVKTWPSSSPKPAAPESRQSSEIARITGTANDGFMRPEVQERYCRRTTRVRGAGGGVLLVRP